MEVERKANECLALSWQDAHGVIIDTADDQWIYRGITDQAIDTLKHVETNVGFEKLSEIGVVRSERADNGAAPSIPGFAAMVRHHRVRRILYPQEWTMEMWREALASFCELNVRLRENGLTLTDAQPHNIVFDADGKPVFIDFGSLKVIKGKGRLRYNWHREFKDNFLLPVALHNAGFHDIAQQAKREPFESTFRKTYRWSCVGLLTCWVDVLWLAAKLFNSPRFYFNTIKSVFTRFRGKEITRWTDYKIIKGEWKAAALEETLASPGIASVLDVAGNKGAHILEASKRGFTAIITDIDEASLEMARAEAQRQNLPLFVGKLDLTAPTPEWGKGLLMPGSFQRLRSDLVMALAVSHHMVYRAKMPFRTFATILDRYSKRYIFTEYVDLKDFYVKDWVGKRGFPPSHYSEAEFVNAFSALGYKVRRRWNDEAGARAIFLFEKTPAAAN